MAKEIPNRVELMSPKYNMRENTGKGLKLNNTPLAIPIHHTLGSDIYATTTATAGITYSAGSVSADGLGGVNDGRISLFGGTLDATATYKIVVNASSVVGSPIISRYYNGSAWIEIAPITITDGENELVVMSNGTSNVYLGVSNNTTWSYTEDSVTFQEITSMSNSFLTYQDITTKEIIQLGNSVDGGSSKRLEQNGDFDDGGDNWTTSNTTVSFSNSSLIATAGEAINVTQSITFKGGRTYNFKSNVRNSVQYFRLTIEGVKDLAAIINGGDFLYDETYTFASDVTANLSINNAGDTSSSFIADDVIITEILPTSTTYTFNNKTVNNILTHSEPFDTNSMTALNANPNLLAKLAMKDSGESINELNVFMDRSKELVTNGGFDTDTEWSKGTGWIIGEGKATSDGLGYGILSQLNTLIIGKTYRVTFDITEYTSGDVRYSDTVTTSATFSGIGSYTVDIVAGGNNFGMQSVLFLGSIDNISVKEIKQDSYYACSENEGAYVVDARAGYSASNANVTSWLPQQSGTGNSITSTGTVGEYNIVGVVASTQVYLPRIIAYNANFVPGELYLMKATVKVNSGAIVLWAIEVSGGIPRLINETLTAGETKEYYHIANNWSNLNALSFDGTIETAYDVTARLEMFKINSVSEIANYASTVRTEATLLDEGIQTSVLDRDGAGVPFAYIEEGKKAMYDDTALQTFFRPNLERYAIREIVEGDLQNFGFELKDITSTAGANGMTFVDNLDGTYDIILDNTTTYTAHRVNIENAVSYKTIKKLLSFKLELISGISIDTSDGQWNDGVSWQPGYVSYGDAGIYQEVDGTIATRHIELSFHSDTSGIPTIWRISNISVKELTPKTNRIEDRVLMHDSAVEGVELNTKTIFDNATGWIGSIGTGLNSIEIANNVARFYSDGTNINIKSDPSPTITVGKTYEAIIEVIAYVEGGLKIDNAIDATDLKVTKPGIYRGRITVQSTNGISLTRLVGATDITISSFSLKEITEENKYYINGVEESVVPALPDPTISFVQGNTSLIGYPDTIKYRKSNFSVRNQWKTAQQIIDDHNAFLLATEIVLTDELDNILTDENGVYLTV